MLGRSGIEVGAVGLGCWAIGGPFRRTADGITFEPMGWGDVPEADAVDAVRAGLDLGVTLFDTSNNYGAGRSERILGRALGADRDRVVIASKFGWRFDERTRTHFDGDPMPLDERSIRAALAASLARLGTDYVDVYLLHVAALDLDTAARVREVLERLVAEGAIRTYGWSTDDPARAAFFAEGDNCSVIEYRLNVAHPAREMLRVCARHGLASLARSPLASGFLTGKYDATSTFSPSDNRHGSELAGEERIAAAERLRHAVAATGRTPAQAALAWVLEQGPQVVPIPGFKSRAQVVENAGAR